MSENYTSFDDEEMLALADWNFQNNEYELSLNKLKSLELRENAPVQTYALLGRIYATIGLFEKAKKAFQLYLSKQTNKFMRVNELFQLGLVERDLGNRESAMQIWDNLLVEYPNHMPALYNKATTLTEIGKHQEAAELLNYILENAEDNDRHIPLADQLLNRIALL